MPCTILEIKREGEGRRWVQERAVGLFPSRDQPWATTSTTKEMPEGVHSPALLCDQGYPGAPVLKYNPVKRGWVSKYQTEQQA